MAEKYLATVLIVEDDLGVIRLQQMRLERVGYRVLVATNAAEALDILKRESIDLLLLDQNLPGGVSGLNLYHQLRQSGYEIPAILITGFAVESVVLESFRAGVYDFVPKTADYLDYLLPTIDRVLKKRRTETQLIESEARLASIIRSALDGVLTVDEQQRISLCNPAAEQMFGVQCDEVIGKSIELLLPGWLHRPSPEDSQSIVFWETEGLRGEGSRFPVEISVSWVETNHRRFWTCLVRDISERKRAQEERERLIREQAARMEAEAARARVEAVALENERLYNQLRQVDRLKDNFLAMLAHELRNPLAPIRNALHLIGMERPSMSATLAENWSIIERQVMHLVRLVDDLLDVSRISQGKIQLQKERIALAEVVARAIESSRPLIELRGHTLTVHVPETPLSLHGDAVRLVQVLSNLLNNAAKYTPERGRIELRVVQELGRAIVSVRDNGMGIPPETLPHLFDLFSQSERTLDRSEGGLGVGLTLVRRLAEMHGGSVEAHSEGSGKGSVFTVRFPLDTGPFTPEEVRPSPLAVIAPRRRVLVVDDNKDSAATLSRLLQVMGHEVYSANDGQKGLVKAEEVLPEIILLDIGLPGMDGYEVCKHLRTRSTFDQTIIVALTGYGSPEDRRQSEQAGFNAHLVKPVDLGALKQFLAHPEELLRRVPPKE